MCGKPLDCLVVSLWSRRFSLPPASLSSGSIVLHVHLGLSWNLSAFVPVFSKVDYGNRSCSSIAFACCLFEFSIWRTLGRLRRGTLYTFPYGIFTVHFRYQVGLVFNAFVYIQRRWGKRRDSSPEVLQLGSGGDGARTQPSAPGPFLWPGVCSFHHWLLSSWGSMSRPKECSEGGDFSTFSVSSRRKTHWSYCGVSTYLHWSWAETRCFA